MSFFHIKRFHLPIKAKRPVYNGFSIKFLIFKFERIWWKHKAFMWRFEISHGWDK